VLIFYAFLYGVVYLAWCDLAMNPTKEQQQIFVQISEEVWRRPWQWLDKRSEEESISRTRKVQTHADHISAYTWGTLQNIRTLFSGRSIIFKICDASLKVFLALFQSFTSHNTSATAAFRNVTKHTISMTHTNGTHMLTRGDSAKEVCLPWRNIYNF
jgi:hypothetical protein